MESEPLYKLKAEFFKTLAHPARIRILELLVERDRSVGECCPRTSAWSRRTCPSSWVCYAGRVLSRHVVTATR